jgi:hypothetical protein
MFAGILVLSALGVLFFLAVVLLERGLLKWQAAIGGNTRDCFQKPRSIEEGICHEFTSHSLGKRSRALVH